MPRTINQIIEAVTNANSLFRTLRDIQPKLNAQGRPIANAKRGLVVIDIVHQGQDKMLLCSTKDDTFLRTLYFNYVSQGVMDDTQIVFLENEMTLFDSYGRSHYASVLLMNPPDTALTVSSVSFDNTAPEREKRVEREGVVYCQSSQGVRYLDTQGNPIIDELFVWGEPLREGRAVVESTSGYGLINKYGTYTLPPYFEELSWNENTNICVAMREGRWEMYDREGRKVTDTTYDWIGEACGKLYPMIEEGLNGFLNCNGQVVIPAEWDEADSFADNLTTVRRDGAVHVIDNQGLLIK